MLAWRLRKILITPLLLLVIREDAIARSQVVSRNIANATREVLAAPPTADAKLAKTLLALEMVLYRLRMKK